MRPGHGDLTISGQNHWDDFAPALRQRSVGDASFSYSIQYLDGQYKISKEDGQVLDRNSLPDRPCSFTTLNSDSRRACQLSKGGTLLLSMGGSFWRDSTKTLESWPSWTTGQWTIAPEIKTVPDLIVGGGGGGSASIERGIGALGERRERSSRQLLTYQPSKLLCRSVKR